MATGTQIAEKESDQAQDREITLSTGKLLGIFFALAIVCGVFFTMGYLLGKSNTTGGRTEIIGAVPTGGSPNGKPSAANKPPETITQTCPPGSTDCAPAAAASNSNSAGKTPDQQTSNSQPASANKAPDQSSASSAGTEIKPGAGGSFMVQVAAFTKQEDADITKTALQKKQYPAFVSSSTGDPLFHVQVGPFSDRKDADAMRTRLVGEGYNAIVK